MMGIFTIHQKNVSSRGYVQCIVTYVVSFHCNNNNLKFHKAHRLWRQIPEIEDLQTNGGQTDKWWTDRLMHQN